MFIFSDSNLCRTRQPAWSPGPVATTTSRRFLLAYTGFQYASELSSRRWCLFGSVYMMQPIAIWLTCVYRPIPCMVAINCVPRRLHSLLVPRTQTATSQRSFAVNGPRI